MARTLTNPEVQPVITQQAVTKIEFIVPHVRNQADTEMVFDKAQIRVSYAVTSYLSNGSEDHIDNRDVRFTDWPAGFKTDVKAVYDKVILDAVAAGIITGAGTDEPLE